VILRAEVFFVSSGSAQKLSGSSGNFGNVDTVFVSQTARTDVPPGELFTG
jgi:hypothetical protein